MRLGLNGRFYGVRVTGVQRFAHEMSARLLEREEVVLLLPATAPLPAGLPGRVRVVRGRLTGHAWEQLELPRQARAAGCDVVLNLSGTAPGWGGPHLVVVYDLTPLTHPHWFTPAFRAWFRLALGRTAQRAAGVVAISRWTRAELERVLAVPAGRVRVVSQGLAPFERPADTEAVHAARRRRDLPGPYLLALGGRSARKNLAFLLEVLARWRERGPRPPPLVVVGEEYAHLHTRAAGDGRAGAEVRFVGHVDDAELHALYTGAAAFCFPSLAEGFGRPPLEAMACGTPALAADYGAAAEVLGDAALVLPLQPDAWIDALARLLHDDAERDRLCARGRAHSERFRWEAAADELWEACREAARRPGAAR